MQKKEQDSSSRNYYSKAQFWDQRYIEKGGFFDWYAEYPELKYAFQSQYGMTADDSILMVGCGNSKLSQQMFEAGYKNICNIDISPAVIQQMKQASPQMQWLTMDATEMTFKDKTFDYVIDKGTMDALIAGRDLSPTIKLLKQCMRVIKQEGQLILITYGSPQGRKKIYQQSLPFNLFDYYFAYVNLNDMSTMINLMRNNLVGPEGQAVSKEDALSRSMKQFMMIKIMRQRRSKQKQFIIWENYAKKIQQIKPTLSKQASNPQNQQSSVVVSNTNQQKNPLQIVQKAPEVKESITQKKEEDPNTSNIKYLSKPQKQSYVYAYSIKRKFGYNFDPQSKLHNQIIKSYPGNNSPSKFQIKGNQILNQSIAKCIEFYTEKQIAHSAVDFISQDQKFSNRPQTIKINLNIQEGVNINVLSKSNIDIKIQFNDFNLLTKILEKLSGYLIEKMGICFHPCPKTYSLFSMIKIRMKAKTTNQLLKKYWYPTFTYQKIDFLTKQVILTLSFPPVLPSLQQKCIQQIKNYFGQTKQIKLSVQAVRRGFVTFPQLNLFGHLNMASLSHNSGTPLNVYMKDFWKGISSSDKEDQSDIFVVHYTHLQVGQKLLPYVILNLLALY